MSSSPGASGDTPAAHLAQAPTLAADATADEPARVVRHDDPQRGKQPRRIGRFALLRVIGQGGMGRVFAAYDEQLDRRVAIKVLRRNPNRSARARVVREAKALAKLSHPNVVQVFEVGEHEQALFIAMEYIRGEPLDRWQAGDSRTWKEILEAYCSAGAGLAAAHAQGLVHRDFKPQNVMVEPRDGTVSRVCVLDFGIAQVGASPASAEITASSSDSDDFDHAARLTATGKLLGTPAYMAPEQFDGSSVTAAADQFSFCVALWEALYGERPFAGRTPNDIMVSVLSGQRRPPPRKTTVPRWVHDAVARGLEQQTARRHASMADLLAALQRDPGKRRRRWIALTAALATAGGAGAVIKAWAETRAERCSGAAEQLVGVWDPARRAEVEAAILGTRLPFATRAWEHTAATLDEYADDWRTMHTQTCAATVIRKEQSDAAMDLRMECLYRARVQLDAVARVFVDAKADVVSNAVEVLGGLTPLDRCEDVAALRVGVEPPLPAEAETVRDIRRLLADTDAQRRASRYAAAQASLQEAKQRLSEVDYWPAHSEVAIQEGIVLDVLGQYDASEVALRSALEQASARRHWPTMQQAAARLMFVVGTRQGRPEHALRYRELAEGLAERNSVQAAFARNNLALVLEAQGEFAQAEVEARRALELRERLLGADHPTVAATRSNLGNMLFRQGKYAVAEREHRAALEIRRAALGAEHLRVAQSQVNLATVLAATGKTKQANELLRTAMSVLEDSLGPESPQVALVHGNLASNLTTLGEHRSAETHGRAALATLERVLGPDHVDVASLRAGLATALLEQGRSQEALALAERAWARFEQPGAPAGPAALTGLILVQALWQTQPADEQRQRARNIAQRALALATEAGDASAATATQLRQWLDAHDAR